MLPFLDFCVVDQDKGNVQEEGLNLVTFLN